MVSNILTTRLLLYKYKFYDIILANRHLRMKIFYLLTFQKISFLCIIIHKKCTQFFMLTMKFLFKLAIEIPNNDSK